MKTASRKAKGRALQNHVRDLMYSLDKSLKDGDVRSTGMGQTGADVQLSPKARKSFPLNIECKNIAKFAGYKFLKQAEDHNKAGLQPVAVVKANREKPIALVDLEYFLKLVKGTK